MKTTFWCDETMVITIPIEGLKDQNLPEKFHCVYKDFYKVFVVNGKPTPLGAAQAIIGVFITALGVIAILSEFRDFGAYNLPSLLFLVTGLISSAAGRFPNMQVVKLSFSLNIISFLWSLFAVGLNGFFFDVKIDNGRISIGVQILILVLLVIELLITLYLTYWLSKAVCRQHFNTLPIILLKRGD